MRIGNKHATKLGYKQYVGAEIQKEGADYLGNPNEPELKRVFITIRDIPFPIQVIVHKEDIL